MAVKNLLTIATLTIFGAGVRIGIDGDRIKYGQVVENVPEARINLVNGYVDNLSELPQDQQKIVFELNEKASKKYAYSIPLIVFGGLGTLASRFYRRKK
jgi:hypothetical protein